MEISIMPRFTALSVKGGKAQVADLSRHVGEYMSVTFEPVQLELQLEDE